jgi:hypothetical protein
MIASVGSSYQHDLLASAPETQAGNLDMLV